MRQAGISARGVRRRFGDVVAVDGMDVEAPAGAVTALIGPNGAGKTTLLLVLATLLVPDEGEVRVGGFDPVGEPLAARAATGWMPDVFGTWDTLTCREVLLTVADAYRVPRARSDPRVRELLALVHLEEFADRPTQVLSRGQKQRLGLARALVHDPTTLLLDEPASGLDPRSRIELRGVLRELAGQGRAVLVSSHVLAELDEMADRAVIVDRGRTVAVRELSATGGGDGTGHGVPATPRPWRVRALDQAVLGRALASRGVAAAPTERDGLEVSITGDEAAADLLEALVRDGVRVLSFHPAAGVLEQAYLDVTASTGQARR